MSINYVPLMLVNMVAGLALLALAVARGLDEGSQEKWAPALAMAWLVGLVCVLKWQGGRVPIPCRAAGAYRSMKTFMVRSPWASMNL